MIEQFKISGLGCAACVKRVEKTVSKVAGVNNCSVNLVSGVLRVEGDFSSESVVVAVNNAGYGAEHVVNAKNVLNKQIEEQNGNISKLVRRLCLSLILLLPLLYLSMGRMMWNWPLPSFIADDLSCGILQALITLAVVLVNKSIFINGFKSLSKLSPNMDSLVALGSFSSFIWSVSVLLFDYFRDESAGVDQGALYMDSAAMILTFITLGKLLEAKSKGKTTEAVTHLMKLKPKTATVIRDNREVLVNISEIISGDLLLIRPGELIPADGVVDTGESSVDESSLTGESIPVLKSGGDDVYAGTTNLFGVIRVVAKKVGSDTVLSQIISMVNNSSTSKMPLTNLADRISAVFVPAVLVISLITLVIWLVCGAGVGSALTYAVAVLVVSCPCALGLATPVAVVVAVGAAARSGVLFKNSRSLEIIGRASIAMLDKTGTVTRGEPAVVDLTALNNLTGDKFIQIVYALEYSSEHPFAGAVMKYAHEKKIEKLDASDFKIFSGSGVSAVVDGVRYFGGNLKFIESVSSGRVTDEIISKYQIPGGHGYTRLFFADEKNIIGIITLADQVKEDSAVAVDRLKKLDLEVDLISGDHCDVAEYVGGLVGASHVYAGVMPQEKERIIRSRKKDGITIMAGDGINDAPALVCADVGVAVSSGTNIAMEAADVILIKNKLSDLATAIEISRKTRRIIYQNLFWAFFYNVTGIPLAAGLFSAGLGWQLNPVFAAVAMSLSSVFVVCNSLRLNNAEKNMNY